MKKNIGKLAMAGLMLTLGAGSWIYFTSSDSVQPEVSEVKPPDAHLLMAQKDIISKAREDGVSEEQVQQLLEDPRVAQYLKRQDNKEKLNNYFIPGGATRDIDSEEIWQLIESIEADGGMLSYEALVLKLEWLERTANSKQEFDQAAKALVETYRLKAVEHNQAYDPYKDTPGFAEYKAEEAKIIAEVQQMTSFPEGKTRQQYLREHLQAAREKAYGY